MTYEWDKYREISTNGSSTQNLEIISRGKQEKIWRKYEEKTKINFSGRGINYSYIEPLKSKEEMKDKIKKENFIEIIFV